VANGIPVLTIVPDCAMDKQMVCASHVAAIPATAIKSRIARFILII
jgi:hypothetical protein